MIPHKTAQRRRQVTTIAKGKQGSWFATVARTNENLPCLKRDYLGPRGEYHEPYFYDPSLPKNVEYVDAIKNLGRVLIATYDKSSKRTGYLEYIYLVEDVRHDETGLRCQIVSKQKIG
jgi:hypothetical protein